MINKNIDLSSLSVGDELDFESFLKEQIDEKSAEFLIEFYSHLEEEIKESLSNDCLAKFNLSQSCIKTYWSWLEGDICGELFINSLNSRRVNTIKESPAMVQGQVFEYWATHQKNYGGDIPDESIFQDQNGMTNKAGKVALSHVNNWNKYLLRNGITDLDTGKIIKYSCEKYIVSATQDVEATKLNKRIVIDLKYGAPDNKFGDFAWHDQTLLKRDKLLLQAKHTQFIHWKNTVKEIPFIFYIADKNNENNAKAREVKLVEFNKTMIEHEKFVIKTYMAISLMINLGLFIPSPELKNCSWCSVKCEDEIDVASTKTLYY